MSKMSINLFDSTVVAPEMIEPDISVPNTGSELFKNVETVKENNIVAIPVIAFFIFAGIVFVYWRKKASSNFRISHIKGKLFTIMGLCLIFGVASLYINHQIAIEESVIAMDDNNGNTNNTLSVTVDDINIDVVKSKSGTFASSSSDIIVNTATNSGYQLSVYAESNDLNLVSSSEEDSSDSVDTDFTNTAISGLSATGKTNLTLNTWGIAINQSTAPTNDETNPVWQAIPSSSTSALTIKEVTSATEANDKTTVYYGVNVDDTLPTGIYSNTLVYTAIAKPTPEPEPEPEPTCGANNICYDDNGANSPTTMGKQSITSKDTKANLWASNFQRSGYGFAGWNTAANGSGTNYGPNETITDSTTIDNIKAGGLKLYAMWVAPAKDSRGNELTFQTTNLLTTTLEDNTTLSSKSNGYVTALKDQRDGQVYAVAKLADGNYWMIENLRLEAEATRGNTNRLLSQGYGGNFVGLADPETVFSKNGTNLKDCNSLYCSSDVTIPANIFDSQGSILPRYNNTNTTATIDNMTNTGQYIYSYGNYYDWPAAMASTLYYTNDVTDTANTSICPANWRLPALSNGNTAFDLLNTALEGSNDSNIYRKYPYNFIKSGNLRDEVSSNTHRGYNGLYWSRSGESFTARQMSFDNNTFGYFFDYRNYIGLTVRCVMEL